MADTKESTNTNLQIEKIQAFLKQYCADTEFEVRPATKDDLAKVLKTLEGIARYDQKSRSELQKYKEIDLENTLYLNSKEIDHFTENLRGYHFLQYMEFDHRTMIYHLYPIHIFLQHIDSFLSRLEKEKLSILNLTDRFNVNYNLFNENQRYLSNNKVYIDLDPVNSLFNPSEQIMLRFNDQNSLHLQVHNLITLGVPRHHLTIKDIWCTFPMSAITTQNTQKITSVSYTLASFISQVSAPSISRESAPSISRESAPSDQASAPSQTFLPSQATVVSAEDTEVEIAKQDVVIAKEDQSGHDNSEHDNSEHDNSEHDKSEHNKMTNS